MPVARFQMPDGRVARFEVPDGTTPEQAEAMIAEAMPSDAPQPLVSRDASNMAADGMGALETLAVATGQGFDKAAMGLRELALKGVRRFAPGNFAQAADRELQAQAEQEAIKDSAYAGLQKSRPISTGIGQAVPALMASGGMGLVPAAITMGGFESMKPGTTQERLTRAGAEGAGALVGGWVGQKVGGLVAPVGKKMLSATQREALKIADNIGYKPRLSELTGSPYVRSLEDFASRTPGGSGVMADFAQTNQAAINRAAARSIGEKSDEMTPGVFAAASDRLGQVFENLKSLPGKPIAISFKVGSAADEVLRVQGKMIPAERDAALVKLAEQAKMLATNSGKIDGETYQLVRSGLSSASFDATGTNKALYGKLLKALDDAAEQSLRMIGKKDLADALKSARPQYGNLKVLERGAVSKGGDVNPAAVASALRTANPAAFREGRMAGNPLYGVGVLGERLRPLQAGSPTYEREVTSSLLDTALKAVPAYAAAKLTTGSIPRGYAGLLATNEMAGLLAQPIAQIAQPGGRALGGLLSQRFLIPSVPVFAE